MKVFDFLTSGTFKSQICLTLIVGMMFAFLVAPRFIPFLSDICVTKNKSEFRQATKSEIYREQILK